MASVGEHRVAALPPCARLLHIGLPKTGTTALQSTARAKRQQLREHGVRYPGGGMNHREAVSSLMGRRWGWIGPGAAVPPMRHWDRLMAEVDADDQSRIWISHEFVSESDDATAQKFADALGPRLHIAITLRPFSAILASSWQQYLKGGTVHTFEHWLSRVLAEQPDLEVTPSFHLRNDQAGVVRRWASVVGPANVTAVVVDKANPTLLTDSFEQLFGLPHGFLVDSSLGGLQKNRSMSWPESELLRGLNLALRDRDVDWSHYEKLLRNGAIARLLESRTPTAAEGRVLLPGWAAERATARGRGFADAIAASGVNVVGDLQVLAAPLPGTADIPPAPAEVPLDAATEALAGLLSAALDRGPYFAPRRSTTRKPSAGAPAPTRTPTSTVVAGPSGTVGDPRLDRALAGVTTRALVRLVAARVRRRAARSLPLGRR